MLRLACLLIMLSVGAFGAKFPSEIPRCKNTDSECLSKALGLSLSVFKNGRPDLGIPVLEPLGVTKMELIGQPGKSVTLSQKYENVKIHGISESKMTDVKLNFENGNCAWEMLAITPILRMEADYELKGQILVFPINGHGKCNVTMYNMKNYQTMKCERYQKKGKTYIRVLEYKEDLNPGAVEFKFQNILPGNEQISQEIDKTINENSLSIFKDVKSGFEQVFDEIHRNAANGFLSKFSEDELYIK